MAHDFNAGILLAPVCDICDDSGWVLLGVEEHVGFVYAPCPKCCYPPRAQTPIPAPVDVLALASDSKRIALGEDEAWRGFCNEEERCDAQSNGGQP